MVFNMTSWRTWGVWLTSLILAGLVLAACGSAAEPVSEEPSAPAGTTQETAGTPADSSAEQAQESQQEESQQEAASAPEEEAAQEEPEASSAGENTPAPEPTPSGPAECTPATANNDPLVAAIQPYDQIASPSDSDWSKGPADAPVTVIEYGDFQ